MRELPVRQPAFPSPAGTAAHPPHHLAHPPQGGGSRPSGRERPAGQRQVVGSVSLISLGCSRTLVDSELYLGKLRQVGYQIVQDVEGSDAVIINTCSFIQDAVKESVDTILQAVEMKKQGKVRAVFVAGCLVQRFKDDVIKELPEVDGFLGVDGFGEVEDVVGKALAGTRTTALHRQPLLPHQGQPEREALTPSHYAYLKVSEGCLKGCSFCIIPKIKGPLSSRSIEDLVEEARRLVETRGVKELIVVGQDTSDYGVDRYGAPRIADALTGLAKINGLRWIRLLYFHPRGLTPEVVAVLRDEPRVCKYLDMAIEHADDDVLRRMNRLVTQASLRGTVATLRREIPDIALRTSVIVGFPGETDAAFDNLLAFLEETQFERLGAFQYSPEEGAAAFRAPDQVPPGVRKVRFDRLMAVQQRIAAAVNSRWLGRTTEVIIDEPDAEDPAVFHGRTRADCPEVDGGVYVHADRPLAPGDVVPVTITDTYEYDLVGRVVLAG